MKKTVAVLVCLFLSNTAIFAHTFQFIDNKINGALSTQFIKNIAETFKADIFFETGTYNANTTLICAPLFKEVHTVELHSGMYESAKKKLANHSNTYVYHGSSADIILEKTSRINGTILFWLDAHYSGEGTALSFDNPDNENAITPIRQELEAIERSHVTNCVILIDDMRGFGVRIHDQEFPGCWAYPLIQDIQKTLLRINPNFELALLGDSLLAYDKTVHTISLSPTVVACTQTRLYDGKNLSDNQLIAYEKDIMDASSEEKTFIADLYNKMTNYKDPMFYHDLWYGLISLGNKNFNEALNALSKVKNRFQHFDNNRQVVDKIINYDHWRIDYYINQAQ